MQSNYKKKFPSIENFAFVKSLNDENLALCIKITVTLPIYFNDDF